MNPWITLFVIDLPAVIALIFVKPNNICNIIVNAASSIYGSRAGKDAAGAFNHSAKPSLTVVSSLEILLILTSSIVLAINKPAVLTSSYEILEPETWIGKELPILEHIDIANQLKTGDWLVLFYHYNCHDCQIALRELTQIAEDLKGNEGFIKFAMVEVPPFGPALSQENLLYSQLPSIKEWFITTPAMVLMKNSKVTQTWEQDLPDLGIILNIISSVTEETIYP